MVRSLTQHTEVSFVAQSHSFSNASKLHNVRHFICSHNKRYNWKDTQIQDYRTSSNWYLMKTVFLFIFFFSLASVGL